MSDHQDTDTAQADHELRRAKSVLQTMAVEDVLHSLSTVIPAESIMIAVAEFAADKDQFGASRETFDDMMANFARVAEEAFVENQADAAEEAKAS